jgi:hypothetical protein
MVSKLNKSLDALRAIAPALNAVADEANSLVKVVESALVVEMGIGVSAYAPNVTARCRRRDDDDNGNVTEEEIVERLAFGRVDGVYCIHVVEATYHDIGDGCFTELVDESSTRWSSCDRETRLRTFEQLPGLLENITAKATEIAEKARNTAAKIKELIADEDKPVDSVNKAETVGIDEFIALVDQAEEKALHNASNGLKGPRIVRRRPKA